MQITVSGKQVELSDALRTRVSEQLDQITGKYFDTAQDASVTFSRARSFFTCDINVHAGRGLTLRGEGEAAEHGGSLRGLVVSHRSASAARWPSAERRSAARSSPPWR